MATYRTLHLASRAAPALREGLTEATAQRSARSSAPARRTRTSSEMIAAVAGALELSLLELTSAVATELRPTAPAHHAAAAFALAA